MEPAMKSLPRLASLFLVSSLLAALAAFPAAQPARAASIVVNDGLDNTISGYGLCSLREAILNANSDSDTTGGDCPAGSGADTITFAADYTITLFDQLPAVTSEITITGNGAANTILEADVNPFIPGTHRVLEVGPGGDLTIPSRT
jgi:hypothetical protein